MPSKKSIVLDIALWLALLSVFAILFTSCTIVYAPVTVEKGAVGGDIGDIFDTDETDD